MGTPKTARLLVHLVAFAYLTELFFHRSVAVQTLLLICP